jgi:hypothetical protein
VKEKKKVKEENKEGKEKRKMEEVNTWLRFGRNECSVAGGGQRQWDQRRILQ